MESFPLRGSTDSPDFHAVSQLPHQQNGTIGGCPIEFLQVASR